MRDVLKIFTIFTGKQLWWSLFFNKVVDLQAYNCIKKRLQHRYFPVKFVKFSRTPFLQNTCGGYASVAKTDQNKKIRYSKETLQIFLLKHNETKKQKELQNLMKVFDHKTLSS